MLIKRGEVYSTRLKFQGKTYQKSLHTGNRNDALRLEAAFRMSLVNAEFGIIDGGQAPTLSEYEQRLFLHLKANVAPRTYTFYQENFKSLLRFEPLASTKLHKIDPSLVEKFVQWRLAEGVAPVTVNHSLRTLRRALILARDWGLLKTVPKIKMLRGERSREYVLSEFELGLMIEKAEAIYPKSVIQWLLPFLIDTGLRITEACELKREHVFLDVPRPYIHVARGKSKYAVRDIPLTARATEVLKRALKHSRSDYVWTGENHKRPLTRHYPSEQFRLIRASLNLDNDDGHGAVLHSTRHTFLTRLGKAGADAFTIQKLAGHSSVTISQKYVHPDREIKESAIALLDALEKPTNDPFADVPDTSVQEI